MVWLEDSSMVGKEIAKETAPTTLVTNDTDDLKGTLRNLGGSRSDSWNNMIATQTSRALWLRQSNAETQNKQLDATFAALIGIGPKDELEGMMAAQLIAAHNAAMECYRRAMIGEQTFEGRQENLAQANKLSRTYATLVEALNRHRGKGQQKVTVEHVHVHAGGQAVVGVVETPGGGDRAKLKDQPDALQIAHAPSWRCGARTRSGSPCRSPAMPNGRCRMHGGSSPGAPKGNQYAFKHGRYAAEAVSKRREISTLFRAMRDSASKS
jgi:hypothetical protein